MAVKMKRKDSILYGTGQAWKFWVMPTSMILCAVLVLATYRFAASLPAGYYPLLMLAGIIVAVGGFTFACVTIECPACKARWFWSAVSKKHPVGWYDWLFAQSACPMCGLTGRTREEETQNQPRTTHE
jgi:hypothetical protein